MSVVLFKVADGVALITLNWPERSNAWTYEFQNHLFDCVDQGDDDPGVRAIVITGEGRSFCRGLTLDVRAERSDGGPPPARRPSRQPSVVDSQAGHHRHQWFLCGHWPH